MRKRECALAILIAILITQPYVLSRVLYVNASSSTDDWPMFHHDPAHTGYTTSTAPTTTPEVIWASLKGGGSPVIADGYLAKTSAGTVECLNASNGNHLWTQRLPNIAGNAAIYNGYVYTSSGAFNVSTGEIMLNYTNNLGFTTPNIVESIIYIGSCIRGGVFALNATTGANIWDFASDPVYSFPAVANGIVYFASGGNFYALNASTGAKIWNYIGLSGHDSSSPAVANGHVYIGTTYGDNGKVVCLDALNGTEIWKYPLATGMSSPAVAYGCVYIVSNSNVYSLNASTGSLIWNATGGGGQSPAVADGTVYVSCSYNIYALNAFTGAKIWNYTFPTPDNYISTSPAIANGVIYVDAGYSLYAFGTPTPTPSPTLTPLPSPTIPEFPNQTVGTLLIVSLLLATSVVAIVKRAKIKNAQ